MRRIAWFVVFLPITVYLLTVQVAQGIDPTNQALKDPDSPAAADLQRFAAAFGDAPVVLLAFAGRGGLAVTEGDRTRIQALGDRIATMPGVAGCRAAPLEQPDLALLAVTLQDGDPGTPAGEVVAFAQDQAPPTTQVLPAGLPLVESALADLVARERTGIVPWITVALFLATALVYRHLGLAFATLAPALAGIAWIGGLVTLRGHRLDPIAALLEPVLLTIGVAASLHFVEAWLRARRDGLDPAAAGRAASAALRTPATLAAVTTMLGLWSLAISSTPAVVDFGVRAALGVALVHAFAFLLLPDLLAVVAGRHQPAPVPPQGAPWLARLVRHRATVLAGTAAVVALATAALPRVRSDNDPWTMLPRDEPVRIAHEALAARLGGVETFELFAPGDRRAADPNRLLPFLASLQQRPELAGIAGPMRRSSDGDLAIPVALRPGGSAAREVLFDDLDRAAAVLDLDGLVPVGRSVQMARDSHALLHSLQRSLFATLVVLAVGLCAALRSLRLGLLGMVPNVVPCLVVYGALGWLDRPVSVATAMIGCTMLGLIVDNTLHMLHHVRGVAGREPRVAAVRHALDHCRRPMALSSLLLIVGFAVAATSRLATTVEFALLACGVIALAWFGDAVLLPLLLIGREPVREVADGA